MNKYIAILSVGPVQGFIASARKSRDLWSGSWLLSEISKAGAKSLKEQGATLIFPAISKEDENKLEKNSEFSVGNKLQAVIEAETPEELTQLLENTTKAIKARFADEVQAVRSQLSDNEIRTDIWKSQEKDYVEVQYAWVQLESDYKKAVEKASRLLASRKATRDFLINNPDPYQREFMLPKSSLDGIRETVLPESKNPKSKQSKQDDKKLKPRTRAKLALSDSEQLDCVGIIKRLGFEEKSEQFTPFSRICADSWIEKLVKDEEDLTKITNHYKELIDNTKGSDITIATRVAGNKDTDKKSIYKNFAYDGEYLYKSRIEASINKWKGNDDAMADELDLLKQILKPLWKKYGQPQTYGVMLLADGDKMGELIDEAKDLQKHQEITTALSKFAESVRGIMQKSRGHCIYAGGDDVLGLVPLDKAYKCADELRTSFSKELKEVSDKLKVATPTLSVGLAICHNMTPFAVIRDYAKQAESHAKGDHCPIDERRNALGIVLSVRSGADTKLRLRWDDASAHEALDKWVNCYNDNKLPSKVAYAIRDIDLHTKEIAKDDNDLHTKIQTAEVKRMLDQSRTEKGKEIDKELIKDLSDRAKDIGLEELANELIVARWLSAKTGQDLGKVGE